MISIKRKYAIVKKLSATEVTFFEDYIISRSGKLCYLNPKTEELKDISHIILEYTKKGVPIYRIIDLTDTSKFLEIRLDKLVLNTFIGDLEGKIIHKDGDYKNCSLDNLSYELIINKIDNSDSLWINNKEFKLIKNPPLIYNYYISDNGAVYSEWSNALLKRAFAINFYSGHHLDGYNLPTHRLVYSTWVGGIPEGLTINHEDCHKCNNHYSNLTAMTRAENLRHAYNNGLIADAKWEEKDIHTMCQMMEKNISAKNISVHFKIPKHERHSFYESLRSIRIGKSWKDIGSQYNLSMYDASIHKGKVRMTEDDIEQICTLLVNNVNKKDISEKFNISIRHLNDLKNIKRWKHITSKYNL